MKISRSIAKFRARRACHQRFGDACPHVPEHATHVSRRTRKGGHRRPVAVAAREFDMPAVRLRDAPDSPGARFNARA